MSGKTKTRSKRFANPYVGPKPFTSQERDRFFGRSEEIAILEGLVLARRLTLLFAQSGAGKSSLLNAGLIPSLQQTHTVGYGIREYTYQKMKVLPVLSVGGGIPADVRKEDVGNVYVFSALLTLYPQRKQHRKLVKQSLAAGLASKLSAVQPSSAADSDDETPDILIIFDQFEELFTRHPEHWRERAEFFKQVRDALDRYPFLRVLFSMREDYIAELTPYVGLLPDQLRSQFRLERLRERAALDAIRLPAQSVGRRFAEGAAELLVERLRNSQFMPTVTNGAAMPDPATSTAMQTEFVEPVQLQVVCQRLWDKLPTKSQVIERADVEKFGDVQMALQEFYEQAITDTLKHQRTNERTNEISVSELRLRAWFDRHLITPAGTRSLVYKGDTETGSLPNAVVEFLDYAVHIIRPMIRGRDTWYELTHDRLVDLIRRSNQAWRRDHAATWQLQAERWDRENRSDSLLLNAEALSTAQQWLAEQQYTPEPHEQRFLDYSRQGLESTQRRHAQEAEKRIHLAETGWGIIFAQNDPQAAAIQSALQELLNWRQTQAQTRFKFFGLEEPKGYLPGESSQQFLLRFGVGPGLVNYERVPHYLLLIGDPVHIPFEFQYALQTQYAVGRLSFASLLEYANYARSVVQAENGSFSLPPKVTLFGPQNPGDAAANNAATLLFSPLLSTLHSFQQDRDWEVNAALQAEATKERLQDVLGGPATPALFFSGSHGLTLPNGEPLQQALQGAIRCQVVKPALGPNLNLSSPDAYFAGHDLGEDARLLGSIAFLYGGCSAGTPQLDNFPAAQSPPQEIAPAPFIASLPQRLLGHANGGMLAVVGHVDQSWTTSFSWKGMELGSTHFSSILRRLMEGYTVGAAVDPLNQRYALLASLLAEELQQITFYGAQRDQTELTQLNRTTVDARNFIILGDPAVRLPLENGPATDERPIIEPINLVAEMAQLESTSSQTAQSLEQGSVDTRSAVQGKGTNQAQVRIAGELLLYFNGVNGVTGEYWTAPLTADALVTMIRAERAPEDLAELQFKSQQKLMQL